MWNFLKKLNKCYVLSCLNLICLSSINKILGSEMHQQQLDISRNKQMKTITLYHVYTNINIHKNYHLGAKYIKASKLDGRRRECYHHQVLLLLILSIIRWPIVFLLLRFLFSRFFNHIFSFWRLHDIAWKVWPCRPRHQVSSRVWWWSSCCCSSCLYQVDEDAAAGKQPCCCCC